MSQSPATQATDGVGPEADLAAEPGAGAGAGRITKTGVALFLFVLMMGLSIALSGWEEALDAVIRLGPWKILALCALAGAHYLLRALRWHLIVRASGVGTTVSQNARHFFGGFAMTATPGRVGELVRLRWLRRESGWRLSALLPIVMADRAIELGSMILLIAAALLATSLGTGAAWWLLLVAGALTLTVCRPKMLERGVVLAWRAAGRRKPRLFAKLRRVARGMGIFMTPKVLIPTLAIGAVGWGLEGAAFWLLLDWLGASIDLPTASAIFLVAILSGALSGLPGGLGGTEATSVALLLLQGVPTDMAVLATAIIRISTLWFAVLIGFLVFPAAEMRSAAALEAREAEAAS